MNPNLVKYLSSVMRGAANDQQITHLTSPQPEDDPQFRDLVKDHFLVDSIFALGLDELI